MRVAWGQGAAAGPGSGTGRRNDSRARLSHVDDRRTYHLSWMRSIVERELKLDLGAGFVLPDLPGERLESRLFTSTYFDTPDHSLAAAGLTLRRRVENGLSKWQLKLPRAGDARAELEAPGGPVGPPASLAGLLVAHVQHGRLEPVATLRTRRAGVRVADHGREIADVTLDSVSVLDAGRSAGEFAELEIEAVDGDDADLERLARMFRKVGAKSSDGVPKLLRVLPPPDAVAGDEGCDGDRASPSATGRTAARASTPRSRGAARRRSRGRSPLSRRHASQSRAHPRDDAGARRPAGGDLPASSSGSPACSAPSGTSTC